jgi:hypothetical protein
VLISNFVCTKNEIILKEFKYIIQNHCKIFWKTCCFGILKFFK